MEYLISPWYIYLIGIVGPIKGLTGVISSIGAILSVVIILMQAGEHEDSETYNEISHTLKLALFITLPNLVLYVLIPSEEILIQMYIASLTTPENLQTIKDLGVSLTEFLKGNLLDIIKEVKK